ncbi:MAG: 5-formyltetrahydrofolate cyclo-ligase [Janthinobacterium lividum]
MPTIRRSTTTSMTQGVVGHPDAGRPGPGHGDLSIQVTPAIDVTEMTARKLRLRRELRAARRAEAGRGVGDLDADLARVLMSCPLLAGARRVACYTSMPGEPGTRATLAQLRRNDVDVLLPVLLPDADLDWELLPAHDTATAPGHLGPHAIATADVVIVPALAVDTAGHRLGQGGGSYDRALVRAPARVPVLAVVHDEELLDAAVSPLPSLPHDRPVHAVATPTRWLWLMT